MNITITSDLKNVHKNLDESAFKRKFTKTANKSMRSSLDDLNRKIEGKFNIKVREISNDYFVIASVQDGVYNKRGGVMTFLPAPSDKGTARAIFKGSPVNLSRFALIKLTPTVVKALHKKRKSPQVKILKSGPSKTVPGSFAATMRSGHTGIFQRRSDGRIIELREITYASMAKQVDFDKIFDKEWKIKSKTMF